jgi:hypothetical protein
VSSSHHWKAFCHLLLLWDCLVCSSWVVADEEQPSVCLVMELNWAVPVLQCLSGILLWHDELVCTLQGSNSSCP